MGRFFHGGGRNGEDVESCQLRYYHPYLHHLLWLNKALTSVAKGKGTSTSSAS